MYRIGDFAKLTGCSVKTLRYYDEIDLLKPSSIDNFTNYRYYSENELEVYRKIEHLKKLGFTLDEIKENINNMSLKSLDLKKQELLYKIDYMMHQIEGINELKIKLSKNKVKSLKS